MVKEHLRRLKNGKIVLVNAHNRSNKKQIPPRNMVYIGKDIKAKRVTSDLLGNKEISPSFGTVTVLTKGDKVRKVK